MNNITFCTTNKEKIKEASEILEIKINSIDLQIDEIQTLDPIKCVEKKAQAAYFQTKNPVLVEDTCLFFDAWNSLPGVFIDYFMKTIGNDGLIKLMKDETNRMAKAQTSISFHDGNKIITTTGIIKGTVAQQLKGEKGFGWDPIFIPQDKDKTFAEIERKEKNKISMRRIALEKLKKELLISKSK